ncbi:PDR/VanB family oxidoreductase [Actinoallomurus sp. CA-150999]|uniref:PDR/VanB family oxidoreductase n=1 Tax=Actinoallomurus sp. CA-150999 TaxID=3239887 RepID=UPI003D906F2C
MPSELPLEIVGKTMLTPRICRFEFADPSGAPLPAYAAGAHVTVHTPSGLTRSYSLNEPGSNSPYRYVVAVARNDETGGSASLHGDTKVGDHITVSRPRNAFGLSSRARDHLLVAGGIGITPIRSMLHELRRDRPQDRVRLLYLTRRPEDTAYLEELSALGPEVVRIHHSDLSGQLDLWEYLGEPGKAHVYCCGPKPLMNHVRALTMHWDPRHVHFEDFVGVAAGRPGDRAFAVIWEPTNAVIEVAPDQTIVEALREAGIQAASSCNAGACGTCMLRVLAGTVEHRDLVLTEDERETMISACVSRAVTPTLELAPIG